MAQRFGRLDILINNAGVFALGQVHDRANNIAELDRMFAVNVGGVASAVRAAAPLMSDGGRIISIGSVVGESTPFPGAADYSATKAALLGYTRGWARDLGPKGITVNTIQPGPIDTDMNPADNGDFSDDPESDNCARPLRHCGRSCRGRRIPGRAERRLHHRHDLDRRRRIQRVVIR